MLANFHKEQSAYLRSSHSTETALVKIFKDVYENKQAKSSTIIVTLDISAAFDMICNSKPLDRPQEDIWIEGQGHGVSVLLLWIAS